MPTTSVFFYELSIPHKINFCRRVRFTSVQTFSDQDTKTIQGYKEGPVAGAGSKPHKIEKASAIISGSCAGAGSEQFHIYLSSRRRELDRIDGMEVEFVKLEEDRIFAEKLIRNKLECEEKTKKNSEKRKRKKGKKTAAKKKFATGAKVVDDDGEEEEDDDDKSDHGDEPLQITIKRTKP